MKNWKVWQHDTGTYITAETVPPGEKLAPMIAKINGHNPANARLIAAAPEMLNMLLSAENWFREYDVQNGPDSGAQLLLENIRAAIAKATGEPQK